MSEGVYFKSLTKDDEGVVDYLKVEMRHHLLENGFMRYPQYSSKESVDIIFHNNKKIGYMVSKETKDKVWSIEIHSLYIGKAYRYRGWGSKFLKSLNGLYSNISLIVDKLDTILIHTFLKNGYSKIEFPDDPRFVKLQRSNGELRSKWDASK